MCGWAWRTSRHGMQINDARVVHDALEHLTFPQNPQVRGAAEGSLVWRREDACSRVPGKFRQRGARPMARASTPSSRQPLTTTTVTSACTAVLGRFSGREVERAAKLHPLWRAREGPRVIENQEPRGWS
jgi:hypothetical protein